MNNRVRPYFAIALMCLAVVGLTRCGKKEDPKGSDQMSASCYLMQKNGFSQGYGQNYGQGYNPGYNQGAPTGGACNFPYQSVSQGFTNFGGSSGYLSTGGYGMGSQSLISGCASGQAVYSPIKGLGCVDNRMIYSSGSYARYALNRATNTFTLVGPANGQSPYGYNQNPYGYNQPVYGQPMYGGMDPYANQYGNQYGFDSSADSMVARVCDQAEPCPKGLHCRSPLGPYQQSAIGICYY